MKKKMDTPVVPSGSGTDQDIDVGTKTDPKGALFPEGNQKRAGLDLRAEPTARDKK